MLKKFDKDLYGVIAGLILPFIVVMVYYQLKFDHQQFIGFLGGFMRTKLPFSCVVINLLLFFAFIWRDFNFAARGVVGSTIFYALLIVIFKFI